MAPVIEQRPDTWQGLEERVASILRECGVAADVGKEIPTARGKVVVDVWAHDAAATPAQTYLLECKHWSARVTKFVVHGFRSVVGDTGANWGGIISLHGFQSGAHEAARYSNVRLMTWTEFQALFIQRWFQTFFLPSVAAVTEPLVEYCEPFNSRIQRKAAMLSDEAREMFMALRIKHADLVSLCILLNAHAVLGEASHAGEPPSATVDRFPALPLRHSGSRLVSLDIDATILDADSLRALLDVFTQAINTAVGEFDAVFGTRA